MKWMEISFIFLFTIPPNVFTRQCSRFPLNTYTPKSPVDENFGVSIAGNPQTYILGQSYNVSLHAYNGHRFIGAKLVLENENGEKVFGEDLGRLEVVDTIKTRYSKDCADMVETTSTNPKTRLDVVWVAPTEPGNGCVLIRATVLQHRDVWFMDDGALTKRVCEEVVDDGESQRKDSEQTLCCACDEARYELTFESHWSRNLHPKYFPMSGWVTRFSDILGAAHTSDYRFWDKGVLASEEMKEFAEHGSSLGLQREFNQQFREGKIRTVIKARGPAFPYMNIPSVASVRVDPLHHQISAASKIMPSPDWIVGIPGLELCLEDCTWLEEKVINLYPWDIGTDAGPSYTSPDQPQFPADVIRRMSSEYPSDPRSPFYDETHAPMRPMATLTIKRQRLYDRKCEDEESNNPDDLPRECFTHPWSDWSKCSAKCGVGRQHRRRSYKQPEVAKMFNCDFTVKRRQERECRGDNCSDYDANQNSNLEDDEEIFGPAIEEVQFETAKSNVNCESGTMNGRECEENRYPKLKQRKNCQDESCAEHIDNSIEGSEEYTDTSSDLRSFRPKYNRDFRIENKSHERLPKIFFGNQGSSQPSEFQEESQEHSFQTEDLRRTSIEEDLLKHPYRKNSIGLKQQTHREYGTTNEIHSKKPPKYCYRPLNITDDCFDPSVIGNFWFYNYCADECMLYSADKCDNNRNKFRSLERCEEHCAMPMRFSEEFLPQKQAQGCEGDRPIVRTFKKKRNYY